MRDPRAVRIFVESGISFRYVRRQYNFVGLSLADVPS